MFSNEKIIGNWEYQHLSSFLLYTKQKKNIFHKRNWINYMKLMIKSHSSESLESRMISKQKR